MVTVEHISFSYTVHGQPVAIFEDFSVTFHEGHITAIIGPSGCGKPRCYVSLVAFLDLRKVRSFMVILKMR